LFLSKNILFSVPARKNRSNEGWQQIKSVKEQSNLPEALVQKNICKKRLSQWLARQCAFWQLL